MENQYHAEYAERMRLNQEEDDMWYYDDELQEMVPVFV